MPFVRISVLGIIVILVVGLGEFSSFAQTTIDPFDIQFKSTISNLDPLPALPKELPEFPIENEFESNRLYELVEFKASAAPIKVKRGGTVRITIDGKTKSYAYTYSALKRHETQIEASSKLRYGSATWYKPLYPIAESKTDLKMAEGYGSYILHDDFQWQQDVFIEMDAPVGKQKLSVQPFVQVCTKVEGNPKGDATCLPQSLYRQLWITLDIDDGPPVPPPADLKERVKAPKLIVDAAPSSNPGTKTSDVRFEDLGGLLVGAIAGAILMLLTPCVFPMIPITVNFFIKQSEKEHHRPFVMASIYAGTIVLLLTCVILVAGQSIINLANKPWFNLGLGVVLILFALGLFGMFEIDLTKFFGTVLLLLIGFGLSFAAKRIFPVLTQGNYEFPLAVASLLLAVPATMALGRALRAIESMLGFEESTVLSFLARQESKGGFLGAAFMAMTFTITSFSCTGPFLGILLAPLAGTSLPNSHLLLAALVYSVTFAAPFFLLALFPTYLKKLPKSGGWMTTIKVTMGFLEIGAALKFFSNTDLFWFPGNPRLFNFDTVLCSWIALSVACSMYLFGLFRLHHDSIDEQIGVPRMVFASLFLGMALYLTPLLFGFTPRGLVMEQAISFLPPDHGRLSAGQNGESRQNGTAWIEHDFTAAWKVAVEEKKLIFIDFTGENCPNCRTNERNVFPRPDVIAELKRFVCVKIYTDTVPKPGLNPDDAETEGLANRSLQRQLINSIAQPAYVVLAPDPKRPFEESRIAGKVLGVQTGTIYDPASFAPFLKNASGKR